MEGLTQVKITDAEVTITVIVSTDSFEDIKDDIKFKRISRIFNRYYKSDKGKVFTIEATGDSAYYAVALLKKNPKKISKVLLTNVNDEIAKLAEDVGSKKDCYLREAGKRCMTGHKLGLNVKVPDEVPILAV
jgi:hypothetical protein